MRWYPFDVNDLNDPNKHDELRVAGKERCLRLRKRLAVCIAMQMDALALWPYGAAPVAFPCRADTMRIEQIREDAAFLERVMRVGECFVLECKAAFVRENVERQFLYVL